MIQPVPITEEDLRATGATAEKDYDPEWFSKTQDFISKIPSLHAYIDELVGRSYKKSEALADIRDPAAVAFARAYKQALDAKKHGKSILLPGEFWGELPEKLHKYLVSE